MLNESNIPLEEDGIEEEILVDEEVAITKAMWGDIGGNIKNQTDLQNALDAKQDSLTEAQLNAVNSGITSEKVTTYDGYADQIANKADQSALNAESVARGEADTALGTRIDNEALARQSADNGLQSQIDAITSKSDVVDVVANYAALQAYDTSTLSDKDVVKVLDDETHEDALTYYRWSTTTQTWSYIGQEAPYYSKGQMDVKLAEKQDKLTAGANIQIENGIISATDTPYTAGNGLNLNGTEFSADTDVLATKEDLEGYYTKPETDNLLAPKLEAEVVTELPATGTEGKLYLTPKNYTRGTGAGNPIEATITDGAGSMEDFQLDGDTYQQSYTGKNLFEYIPSEQVAQGLISTIDSSGVVTVTGTGTARWSDISQSVDNTSPSGTYTITVSTTGTGTLPRNISLRLADNNNSNLQTVTLGINESVTETLVAHTKWRVFLATDADVVYNCKIKIQVEAGSTASDFEPFVGGIASPNPEYPQPIQTVTGLQTVEIVGKNLLPTYVGLRTVEVSGAELRFDSDGDKVVLNSDYSAQTASAGQQIEITTGDIRRWAWTTIEAIETAPDRRITPNGGEYTVSMRVSSGEWSGNTTGSLILIIGIADDSTGTTRLENKTLTTTSTPGPYDITQNISLGDNEHVRNIAFYAQNTTFNNAELTIQLELGSSASDYATYSKQTYPLDLGSIELCKLGTYQDYIYKDGDDWKVHKETKRILVDGSQRTGNLTQYGFAQIRIDSEALYVSAPPVSYCSNLSSHDIYDSLPKTYAIRSSSTQCNLRLYFTPQLENFNAYLDWCAENKPSVVAPLQQSVHADTTITDTTLIAQLEAIRTASLQNGTNTITNTATGTNLAGDMEIGYYGFNPRNRYDKFIWLDLNNNYEQIGGE